MKLNEKAQQIIEYLLIIGAVVGGVLAVASPFKTAVEKSLNKAVETIYGGYTWRTSGFTCTASTSGATCGLGTATQSVWCEADNTAQTVADAFCVNSGVRPPESNIPCNLGVCGNAYWDLGTWGPCSLACGGGVQTQTVVCRDLGGAVLPDSSCPQPPPIGSQPCNSTPCYGWQEGNACISLCSVACGSGSCDQSVTCVNNLTGSTVADSNCTATKPGIQISCNTGLSCGYQWVVSGWGGCVTTTPGCGDGTQTRSVNCVNSSNQVVDPSNCDQSTRPSDSASCNLGACYTWNMPGGWGPCSTVCDAGTQSAIVQCVDRQGAVVADNLCNPALRPASTRACPNQPACVYSWRNTAWSLCSVNCGNGTQTRSVFCDRTFPVPTTMPDLSECLARVATLGDRPASQSCTGGCYRWDTTAWSACSSTCGTGTQTRSSTCKNGAGVVVANSNCIDYVGNPPAASQGCTGTSSCCGNGECVDIPAVGYVENCTTCYRDCFRSLCVNDGDCKTSEGEDCTNSSSDCNSCSSWKNGSCGAGASPACSDGYRRQTRKCACSGDESQCVLDTNCAFSCTGIQAANSTACSGDETGLTGNVAWSYVNTGQGCTSAKCEAYCDGTHYQSYSGGCKPSCGVALNNAGMGNDGFAGWGCNNQSPCVNRQSVASYDCKYCCGAATQVTYRGHGCSSCPFGSYLTSFGHRACYIPPGFSSAQSCYDNHHRGCTVRQGYAGCADGGDNFLWVMHPPNFTGVVCGLMCAGQGGGSPDCTGCKYQ